MNRYSPSKIKTFELCPLQYKNHYIDKIDIPEPISYPAQFGSLVHDFAEHYNGENTRDIIKLVSNYKLNEEYSSILAPTLKSIKKFVQKYMKYEHEPEQELELKNDKVWLYGIIDRIMKVGDKLVFVDYKTSKFVSRDKHLFQMSFYNLMISKVRNIDPRDVMCILYFPRADAEEKITFTKTKMQIFESDIYRKIDRIEANIDWNHKPGKLCPWCKWSNTEHCPVKVEKKIYD